MGSLRWSIRRSPSSPTCDAAARNLKSELGITKRPKLVGKTQMRDGQSTKFIAVYALRWDGPISPNPSDFAAIQFRSLKPLDQFLET